MVVTNAIDIVFVIDASRSMRPCIDALRDNIGRFVSSLAGPNSRRADTRLEFVALKVDPKSQVYGVETCRRSGCDLVQSLYGNGCIQASQFWAEPAEFTRALATIETGADEDTLLALDFALDLPWRPARSCCRAIVLLTDEPIETGFDPEMRRRQVEELRSKLVDSRVTLFIVAPYSEMLVDLALADRCDYITLKERQIGNGLADVDLTCVLSHVSKSISLSTAQSSETRVQRALFAQDQWVAGGPLDLEGSR